MADLLGCPRAISVPDAHHDPQGRKPSRITRRYSWWCDRRPASYTVRRLHGAWSVDMHPLSTNGLSYVVAAGVVSNQVASVAGMDHSTDAPPELPVAMKQVEADARVLSAALAEGAVRDLSHEELGELVAVGRAVQARIDAAILAAVGEVDARGSFATDGALTAGAWLRSTVTVTPAEAAGAVRTARALRGGLLPGTQAALAAGEIWARHAQAIADGIHTSSSGGHRGPAPAAAVALIEPEVLQVARTADTRAVGSVLAAFQHALDPEAADAAALRRFQRRGLTLAPTPDRTWVIHGLADESSAAIMLAAIDAASPLVAGDTRSPAQIRLDALVGICRQYLENPDAPVRGGGGHPHLIVTTDDATLFPADHRREHIGGQTRRRRPPRPGSPAPGSPRRPGRRGPCWPGSAGSRPAPRSGWPATGS